MLLVEIILSLLFLNSIHQSKCQNLDATMLSNQLSILTNDVLGVQTMQDILNKYDYDNIEKENGGDLADTLKTSLQYKYQNAIDVTKQLVEIVKTSISSNNEMSAWPQCCEVSLDGFEDNHQFKQPTDFSKLCTRISSTASAEPHMLSEDAFNEMKTIYNQQNVLWQFYGDDVGGLHQYPTAETLDCVKYDARYRPWFIEAATPMPKDVVLVIDRSGSMSTEHNGRTLMDIAQEAAITVLKTLNPSDRVGLVSFSTEASTPDSGCHSERLAEASAFNGLGLEAEINNISPSGDTYYVNAINLAFDLLESSIPENQFRSQLILFLTDGIPTDSKDAVMETLLQRNQVLLFKVTILTFGFGIGIDESTGILSDIALQNYQKYNLTPDTSVGEIHPGEYTYVSNPDNLRASMASYYNFISGAGTHNDILITVPYADAFGAGLLSSVLKPVRINGEFRGVVGTDIPLAEIFEDLTYFKQGEYSYAFMFDKKESVQGRTLTHPLLPLTQVVTNDYSIYVHITTLERAPEFKEVYNDTISNIPDREEGQRTFVADKIIARGDTFGEGVDVVSVRTTYYWRQVEGTTLVAVLALVEEDIAQLFRQEITGNPFVYHRIDIWKPSGIVACNHLGDYATDTSSVVFMTADAYVMPTNHLEVPDTVESIKKYTNYMNGNDGTANPFRDGIRDEVFITHLIDDTWLSDVNNDNVATRYIGTANGVLRFYPGFRMNKYRDFTNEQWFAQAVRSKDSLIITASNFDSFRASYRPTVSLSRAITFRGSSKIFGVMGMDITLDYFYKTITDLYPDCQDSTYNCFVMDRSGYLIVHQDLLSNYKKTHIVDKERLLSVDLIENGIMVRKACINYQDIKRQYYYEITDIEGGVHDKLKSIDCLQYRLQIIPRTNAVLVIISFQLNCNYNCYCSPLNCVSEDPSTCECPCAENEQLFDYCDFRYNVDENSAPSCSPPLYVQEKIEEATSVDGLQTCLNVDCSVKSTLSSCSSSLVCEICDESKCKSINGNCQGDSTKNSNQTGGKLVAVLVVIAIFAVFCIVVVVVYIVRRKKAQKETKQNPDTPDQPTVEPMYLDMQENYVTNI